MTCTCVMPSLDWSSVNCRDELSGNRTFNCFLFIDALNIARVVRGLLTVDLDNDIACSAFDDNAALLAGDNNLLALVEISCALAAVLAVLAAHACNAIELAAHCFDLSCYRSVNVV